MSQRSSAAAAPPSPQEGKSPSVGQPGKTPKTERGKRTLRKLLDAAAGEFGALGYHEASIAGVTARAGVALGTFYVYFDSKESVFRALVADMGRLTRAFIAERVGRAGDRLTAEREGIAAFIAFARTHKDLYRIVMEAQFVAPDAYRSYYEDFAEAYRRNLQGAAARGEISAGAEDVRAWALIGMSVFLGLRFGIWSEDADANTIAADAGALIADGLAPTPAGRP
jgi:AcrR family transcriptional regulator